MDIAKEKGTLEIGECHPATDSALKYIKSLSYNMDWFLIKESIASLALSGNRLAEICFATLERLEKHEPVSDRYLLGLAWTLKDLEKLNDESNS